MVRTNMLEMHQRHTGVAGRTRGACEVMCQVVAEVGLLADVVGQDYHDLQRVQQRRTRRMALSSAALAAAAVQFEKRRLQAHSRLAFAAWQAHQAWRYHQLHTIMHTIAMRQRLDAKMLKSAVFVILRSLHSRSARELVVRAPIPHVTVQINTNPGGCTSAKPDRDCPRMAVRATHASAAEF